MVSFNGVSLLAADNVPILSRIDLSIAAGERVALIGPSGCGKTTLLEILVGFKNPTCGSVVIDGDAFEHSGCPRSIGYMPQNSLEIVLPWRTCRENLTLVRQLRSGETTSSPFSVDYLLEKSGLKDRANAYPLVLSGGELRRLAFSMILSFAPRLVLLDEPFTGVDLDLRFALWDLLHDYQMNCQTAPTVILITHSMEEAAILCDYAVFLKKTKEGTCVSSLGKRRSAFPGDWSKTPRNLYRERASLSEYLSALDYEFESTTN